ncbi:hypothetical protein EVAR_85641_1 [Eumeta japonica]|uniref:Uncharacterized protein n=1 Tax=Eumeta variegata TaxID=151549 RepID=A0A4C1XV80_EUMVA|nr:hypothetical protein EVAR_85641_1 [Eumeta japonica]
MARASADGGGSSIRRSDPASVTLTIHICKRTRHRSKDLNRTAPPAATAESHKCHVVQRLTTAYAGNTRPTTTPSGEGPCGRCRPRAERGRRAHARPRKPFIY